MWQNNGFGNSGHFQNFNNQEAFTPPSFGGSPGPLLSGQQFFASHPNIVQYDDGEGFINNDFQPEVGIFNEAAYMQNQFMNATVPVSFAGSALAMFSCGMTRLVLWDR